MEILLHGKAEKKIMKLDKAAQKRIMDKLLVLGEEGPFSLPYKKIAGVENRYRVRIGEYRIIYEIERGKILVLKIGKRENVYE